jgi:hypothetical protein
MGNRPLKPLQGAPGGIDVQWLEARLYTEVKTNEAPDNVYEQRFLQLRLECELDYLLVNKPTPELSGCERS